MPYNLLNFVNIILETMSDDDDNIRMIDKLNEDDYKLKFSDLFEYLSVIGQGAFGIVIKAKSKTSNNIYAVKVL